LESTSFNTDNGITIYNFSKLYSIIPKGITIAKLINTEPSRLQDDTAEEKINTTNKLSTENYNDENIEEIMDKQVTVIKISHELNISNRLQKITKRYPTNTQFHAHKILLEA
jgi:hypothetical protein